MLISLDIFDILITWTVLSFIILVFWAFAWEYTRSVKSQIFLLVFCYIAGLPLFLLLTILFLVIISTAKEKKPEE